MPLEHSVAERCEELLGNIKHANAVLSDPYAPMHKWPIEMKEKAEAELATHNLHTCNAVDGARYPLLSVYVAKMRTAAEYAAEQKRQSNLPETKLRNLKRDCDMALSDLNIECARLTDLHRLVELVKKSIEAHSREVQRTRKLYDDYKLEVASAKL